MSETAKPVILVDGSSYLFRAFHAIPMLTNSKGLHTNAIKGVISMVKRLNKDYPESQVIVIFDAKGKTFRNDIYPEYKAHRPPMPDELREQIEPIHNIIRAMGLPLLIIDGVEADDVIGTLAAQALEHKQDVIVSTGDKDMAQLVNEHVSLINTMNDVFMDVEGVKEKFGVPPEHIIDYLALMGDKVDNIPGVPKVGEKTAVGLVAGLGSLEDIYANLDKVKELSFRGAKTLAPKLEEHKDQAFLSKELATIKCDVELEQSLTEIKSIEPDQETLLGLFRDMEFKAWIAELSDEVGDDIASKVAAKVAASAASSSAKSSAAAESDDEENIPTPEVFSGKGEYEILFEQAELDHWIDQLKSSELFAFDTETTSLNYKDAEIVGVSFCTEAGKAAYVPLAHDYAGAPEQLDRDAVLAQLKPILDDKNLKKVGQHMKYDAHVLANYGIQLKGVEFDTMLESYVLDSVATKHDMDSLSLKYLGHKTVKYEDIAGKGAKQLTFNQIGIEEAGPYAAEDADITLRLHQMLWPQLAARKAQSKVFKDIEMPVMPVLFEMEENGALIDAEKLHEQSAQIEQRLQELERAAHDSAGQVFNLGSPKQLAEILFEKQGLPVVKKTPKGAPSTAEEVLQELAEEYELPRLILENRGLAKLKSTYTDKLPLMMNSKTGRVHTSYHQAVAATGRLSSTDPNLQNIPIRSEEGRKIRQAFIAPEGYKLVAADYSQIELRIMAHLSGDQGLVSAFAEDRDVHRATAAEVFGEKEEDVTDNQRRSAKAINFGLIYGMSAFGLAKQLGIARGEAQDYVSKYFERYPGVREYMDNTREQAKEQGYVETLYGRRLYLPDIRSSNVQRHQHAERTAINAPMQGTAADIIKRAMIRVHEWLPASGYDAKLLMQVHDELILEVREDQAETFAVELKTQMQCAATLDVPLIVDVGIGDNWEQAH
ncbi:MULTISPECIES: DNA polymerase I [Thalassolituus]|uniref:DNA polymerase I n=1 Tax=Thalassolituus TaxID=187492 RepID=UPI000C65BCAA|nr:MULTISPECIES: DNA polymerase I [Thalassolituus]MAX86351.1 DNA polymerase I [Oceanospirillaceae bacterium]|tara:strand:+ start:47888 stop:50707 length:2820 start_codon:yes stop_codon:yes gene_type:complete